jgi:ubiquinone/menaquinone biosynthesis C-methylase UbiE
MNVNEAYDQWAEQYDTNQNKTRDLEAISLRRTLLGHHFNRALEIGCGTGKNTVWLHTISEQLLAVDLSGEMLAVAKSKVSSDQVVFKQADIRISWDFAQGKFDLVTFSLVLEHIEDLQPIFDQVYGLLEPGGRVYIGELHPFKQYNGTKARFETQKGMQTVSCFNHHVSDFTESAKQAGLDIQSINEYFDENDRQAIPRILTLVLTKEIKQESQ